MSRGSTAKRRRMSPMSKALSSRRRRTSAGAMRGTPGTNRVAIAAAVRPLGSITLRGRDDALAVYEPWPVDASADWRERYLAAFALIERDPAQAAMLLAGLAAERQSDLVPGLMAGRLRGVPTAS
jgi:hypothetical protein